MRAGGRVRKRVYLILWEAIADSLERNRVSAWAYDDSLRSDRDKQVRSRIHTY